MRDGHSSASGRGGPSLLASIRKPNYWLAQDQKNDKDPLKNPGAKKFETLTFSDALTKNLDIMDATALALCRENNIPVYVFNLFEDKSLLKAVTKREGGTLISGD